MTIHVVTSPGVISRKNAKRYLSEHLIFPDTVTIIEEDSYFRQPVIKRITFPNGLVHIGARAFQDCIHLQELSLPDSLNSFGKESFPVARHFPWFGFHHQSKIFRIVLFINAEI